MDIDSNVAEHPPAPHSPYPTMRDITATVISEPREAPPALPALTPLNVLLVGNYPNDQQPSMARFAALFARELPRYGINVELIAPHSFFGRLKPSATGLGKWLGYLDKFLVFPFILRRKLRQLATAGVGQGVRDPRQITSQAPPLLVHICDHSSAVYAHCLQDVPHVVTCHDLLAIRSARGEIDAHKTAWTGRRYQSIILGGLNRSRTIACVSNATRDDLLRLSTQKSANVAMIPLGLNDSFSPMPRDIAWQRIASLLGPAADNRFQTGRYILHVGGNQWYKNRLTLLKIYAALHARMKAGNSGPIPRLFLAGKPPSPSMTEFLAIHPDIAPDVISFNRLEDEDLRALYSCADLLLFPSLAEGFGWPILEAQACGCPVAATRIPPMTDVGGSAAAYLDPELDPEDTARQVLDLLRNPPGVQAGLDNARRFSIDSMIRNYIGLYQSLLVNNNKP